MVKLIGLLSLALLGCVSFKDPWDRQAIYTYDSRFDSRRLVYPSTDRFRGMTLELVYCQKELSGFLNLSTTQRLRKSSIEVILKTVDCEETFTVYVNKGRQRVKLSEEILDTLTRTLLEKKNVTIIIGEYEQTFEYKRFNKHFKDLKKKHLKIIEL